MVDAAVQALPADLAQARIAGVVLFGFTRNAQDGGQIPGFPVERTRVFCADGDRVCEDSLQITAAHLSYAADADEAAAFLASMVPVVAQADPAEAVPAEALPAETMVGCGNVTMAAAAVRMAAEFENAKVTARAENMI